MHTLVILLGILRCSYCLQLCLNSSWHKLNKELETLIISSEILVNIDIIASHSALDLSALL